LLRDRETSRQGKIDDLVHENNELKAHIGEINKTPLNQKNEILVNENNELRGQLNSIVFRENENLKKKVRELTENPVTIEKEIFVYGDNPEILEENYSLKYQLNELMGFKETENKK